MLFKPKRHHKRTILEKIEQRVLGLWETREQIHRFRENRLTNEKRRVKFLDALSGLTMISFRSIEKGDQRPRINDGLHRARSP
jgi:hypothetical protein